jgi:hypothetical protein
VKEGTVLECLLHQLWPVFQRAGHVAAVDVVEFGAVDPFVFYVVDFESDVWGDAGWLLVGDLSGVGRRDVQ